MASRADEGLSRKERIPGRARIGELFERGAVGKSRLVLVRALPNHLDHARVSAVAGRAAGKAPVRNRIRRRLRAAFRFQKAALPTGLDMVLLARRGAREASFETLARDLRKAAQRAAEALAARDREGTP